MNVCTMQLIYECMHHAANICWKPYIFFLNVFDFLQIDDRQSYQLPIHLVYVIRDFTIELK